MGVGVRQPKSLRTDGGKEPHWPGGYRLQPNLAQGESAGLGDQKSRVQIP